MSQGTIEKCHKIGVKYFPDFTLYTCNAFYTVYDIA